MDPDETSHYIKELKYNWSGALGIHTHDNMGLAMANSLRAVRDGVTWIDGTVTGMGRGAGNAATENLVLALQDVRQRSISMEPLLNVIDNYFSPLKAACKWGANPLFFLAGQHGIHPTYIQEMLADQKFTNGDILAVLDRLKFEGACSYNARALEDATSFLQKNAVSRWSPKSLWRSDMY